jgi:hypothetical protein
MPCSGVICYYYITTSGEKFVAGHKHRNHFPVLSQKFKKKGEIHVQPEITPGVGIGFSTPLYFWDHAPFLARSKNILNSLICIS